MTRRAVLRDLGQGALAVAVLGPLATACTLGDDGSPGSTETPPPTSAHGTRANSLDWHRVDLGFVSAYVLVRSGEAAVVDTGVEGSADAIEGVLIEAGLDWDAVAHVVLTHKHPDHVGSLGTVAERAADADMHAGEADIPAMNSPRPITPVGDGDAVFGLDIISTPGHTPGHISVLDPTGDLLLAGDALNGTDDGGVTGANPQFSEDMVMANESVRKIAQMSFDIVVFGHGEPVRGGADDEVAALAQSL